MDVTVVGVSTNPDLQSKENLSRGRRSVRKLSEFMNLSYPVGHDDGTLLKAFGDPRETQGQLPLWIVLNDDGKVAHYHAGFYEVDAAQGLKELETVLADLLRQKLINLHGRSALSGILFPGKSRGPDDRLADCGFPEPEYRGQSGERLQPAFPETHRG